MAREYRVWCENGDLIADGIVGPLDAMECLKETIAQHVNETDCDGQGCGVLYPHGFSIQVCEDGRSIESYGL